MVDGRLVQFASFRLEVWPLVPVETEPQHGPLDALGVLGPVALSVGVFDPKDENPALLAGKKPVEEGGSRATDMEVARRRWRHADPERTHDSKLAPQPSLLGDNNRAGASAAPCGPRAGPANSSGARPP